MMYLTWCQTESLLIWLFLSVFLSLSNYKVVISFIKKTLIYFQLKVNSPILKLVNLKIFITIVNVQKTSFNKNWLLYRIILEHYKTLRNGNSTSRTTYKLKTFISLNIHKKLNLQFLARSPKKLFNSVIINKPIISGSVCVNNLSKMVIRKSRWFTKTKYSSIRQECKNIVHLTLFMNISFIMIIFNVYMHWDFLPGFPISILAAFIIYSAPILLKLDLLAEFYTQLFR